jgi:hypothetical protein
LLGGRALPLLPSWHEEEDDHEEGASRKAATGAKPATHIAANAKPQAAAKTTTEIPRASPIESKPKTSPTSADDNPARPAR